MPANRFAIVRAPTESVLHALGQRPDAPQIDLALALSQHRHYCDALSRDRICVVHLPTDDHLPDACFVEDTAVVLGDSALVAHLGAPSRRGEVRVVGNALVELGLSVQHMGPPATLDGGDVLRVGRVVFIGRSARTNDDGAQSTLDFARMRGYRAEIVPVPDTSLHLKSRVTALDDTTILAAPGVFVTQAERHGLRRVEVPEDELQAANVVALRGRVLVPSGFARTAERIAAAGFIVEEIDASQFALADGSLTCLSIRIEPTSRRTRTAIRPRPVVT
jgi:dimethylargininase